MLTLQLNELTILEAQDYLQHAIAPRPVCFASTIDKNGLVNLSPFSFFNLFSSNPPIVVFSPANRARDNTKKHTLLNVLEVPEVVINIVDVDMVQQVSLSSCEFPKESDEFTKAGFTQQAATKVAPPMVKESKIKLECKVLEVKSLGSQGGAGNLVICEVLCMHIDESILDNNKKIDQLKIHHVARLGGDWYCSTGPDNLFKVAKPNREIGMGVDALPAAIRNSKLLTGNHLGQLANLQAIPAINPVFEDEKLINILQYYAINPDEMETELHRYAAELLLRGEIDAAWQVLLANN
ncbi:MAG: flavin reductase family protein [Ferruginibacter sp.]